MNPNANVFTSKSPTTPPSEGVIEKDASSSDVELNNSTPDDITSSTPEVVVMNGNMLANGKFAMGERF